MEEVSDINNEYLNFIVYLWEKSGMSKSGVAFLVLERCVSGGGSIDEILLVSLLFFSKIELIVFLVLCLKYLIYIFYVLKIVISI